MVPLTGLDWALALGGGLLIGLAAGGLMATLGQVAGVSGLLSRALSGKIEAVLFLVGLPLGAVIANALVSLPEATAFASPGRLMAAGLLGGLGARMANGCTSGHSVCGIARLSPRSLVATLLFIAIGAAMVAVAGVPSP